MYIKQVSKALNMLLLGIIKLLLLFQQRTMILTEGLRARGGEKGMHKWHVLVFLDSI